ncbi:MAG: 4-diphosphocytidyl-2-C-methyl-D-erythritol kinase [Candidatus Curtissbacteria bacterium GW2011_GWA1_40_47]|uniref:4-diphosphocytidyl-2-C-methyl-D-erythritol kinase n=1 Tax=Candidatus Curtissbacteria bacterium RIFOXYA1_FULL_41_14 TaxID=1797737 RepID=A0A1F5HCX6_9BACT|nr:MAG: 4-diphosphocytidyl-2-C-methyl-D-erythritol kinase [Candidatus Curtissbacteria bacterium GW2011_GWA2_40_31]KKR64120.1 MAG: 4-diphosphocytidyl-2-C-methyl-D-erythritol kinase [Candidatus Curtissbacteria bacterium GW2011_GWA1_40_47]KKS00863.1 MAG: 4-diphosphocytidyl-2-C-methyl-D-erythritol kinase [Candidatus Curtissbacteria bacterium GW2011_GWC2_41_21]OGD81315.1 MAG: 4-(cytidine 5'-diphospho)-2-C-methyl-D-erythritol kinase [Candidatus Curtissbacteria bacterium RIFCSPHIGHO2_01_FULL_34_40]OGE
MIKEDAFAKLNLNLHIIPKKSKNGFFPIRFLNCQLDLKDEILFESQKEHVVFFCDDKNVPKRNNNLVERAALLLKKMASDQNLGAKITLKKRIPIKAGFGGGSTDAAATVKGLLKLWKLKINEKKLEELTSKLGQDFFYSYYGKLSQFEGEDNKYRIIPFPFRLPDFKMLIVEPKDKKPSSAWMYDHLNIKKIGQNIQKLSLLKNAIRENNREAIFENLHNDFEDLVFSFYPVTKKIKDDLTNAGARRSLLAGAGLSVVGFFDNEQAAQSAKQKLKNKYKQVIITKPIS